VKATNETEALAGDNDVLAEWLWGRAKKREGETATSPVARVWDPVAGLWRTPHEFAVTYRDRQRRRSILGSQEDTAALNNYERGLGYQ
jgi:hypothetical protein